VIFYKFLFTLRFACLAIDHVLGSQLPYLKFSTKLEIAVLSPHTSVEQLVEVDVSVIRADTHFEHHFPYVVVSHLLGKPNRGWKFPEKIE